MVLQPKLSFNKSFSRRDASSPCKYYFWLIRCIIITK
nr:MAG TPA: Somatostatin/Cortistatin family [Caudoviricetes sp.]